MKQFFVIIFLLSLSLFFAQEKKYLSDNEFKELQDKTKYNFSSNIDSVFYYSSIIEKSDNNLHKAFATASKAYYYQIKNDTINSNKKFIEANLFISKTKSSNEMYKVKTYILNLEGLNLWKIRDYINAIKKFEEGKVISNNIGDQIQTIRFNNNIASVNADIGNYRKAIKTYKKSIEINETLRKNLSIDNYFKNASYSNLQLGLVYLNSYEVKSNLKQLDSAQFFFEKALLYSDKLIDNRFKIESNLGAVYYYKKDYKRAEKYYINSVIYSRENNIIDQYSVSKYELGELYYKIKRYDEALICFNSIDSIYKLNGNNTNENIKSNFLQSKIYSLKNDKQKALFYLDKYYDFYMKNQSEFISQSMNINFLNGSKEINLELDNLSEKIKKEKNIVYSKYAFIFFLILILIFFIFKLKKEKKTANEKIKELINEFSIKKDSPNETKITTGLTIDNEKELEILNALEKLEDKKYFLSVDFNQQNVAKKIKTNTTYLSHVVNKNFGKTFSEYSNELKINWVINELIINLTYRKYSTQAIAESSGFKNSISFTKSFKKRAGVTPAQFIKAIAKE